VPRPWVHWAAFALALGMVVAAGVSLCEQVQLQVHDGGRDAVTGEALSMVEAWHLCGWP
jgi:hypothetical protein